MKVTGKASNPMQTVESAKLGKTAAESTGDTKKKSRAADFFDGTASRVDLSTRAQDIKKAKEIASAKTDEIDEAKVARLQKLIDEGKYKVDADTLASKILDEHLLTPS